MTNHWIDLRNSDCVLAMGSNPAENHPISFKWVAQAMDRGADLISVDPRFTRTSALADLYAPIRVGTDIAFLGGLINHIIATKSYFREYVADYTNAGFIVDQDYGFSDGLFSGWRAGERRYDKSTWAFVRDEQGVPRRDPSLTDPHCVFQHLKRHFARYTPDRVSSITGTDRDSLQEIYRTFAATGARDKTGTIMYAMGWTQHTVGVQNIRAMAIIQLLLGNMGRPGGGVNALRGESNVQGSTDHCLLYHMWPGYLKNPSASEASLATYNHKWTPVGNDPQSANWWQNYPKYSVSFLKAMFGPAATRDNEFGYSWLPKREDGRDYSWLSLFDAMYRGELTGLFAWGQNPACSGANADKNRRALAKLDWLVTVNLFDNETASFWKGPGLDPKEVKTEVFLLPCAAWLEKEGSITNSGRWSQWRYKAVDPPGECRSDGEIMVDLWRRIKALHRTSGPAPEAIDNFRWNREGSPDYDPHQVARLINGGFEADAVVKGQRFQAGEQVPSFAYLKDDGTTSSGNWLYCGSYTDQGNLAARRGKQDPTGLGLYPDWAWCWPVNRRIIYNRAGVDLDGQPWSPNKNALAWQDGRWVGDVPDGGWPPLRDAAKTRLPFIMKPDGVASIFGPGLADGPLPEHYEPLESPLAANPMSSQRVSPAAVVYASGADKLAVQDFRFPYVGTTYRVTDHWQSGVMTRWQPWLLETQPRLFVELSRELAREKGIENGELCFVSSIRGKVEAVAMVTVRFKPLIVRGRTVHQVGLPWCFGWVQPRNGGDSANLLTPAVGDPNTRIPETKAFMVNVIKMGGVET